MPSGTDAEFRAFIHDFLAFSARVAEIRAGFGEAIGVSSVSYSTLISVAHLEQRIGGVGVSRVAEHLHLSGAFVTIEVAKLVKAGLLAKKTNELDRRRVLLSVTSKGRKVLDELAPMQAPVNDALFACLSRSEFEFFASLVRRLVPCGDHGLALLKLKMHPARKPGR
jgi:DNA-binding MarR family transcriptional regulator